MSRSIIVRRVPEKKGNFLDFIYALPPRVTYVTFMRYKNMLLDVGYSSLDKNNDDILRRIENILAQTMEGNVETMYGDFELDTTNKIAFSLEKSVKLRNLMDKCVNIILKTSAVLVIFFKKKEQSRVEDGLWDLAICVICDSRFADTVENMLAAVVGGNDAWKKVKFSGIEKLRENMKKATAQAVANAIEVPSISLPGYALIPSIGRIYLDPVESGITLGEVMYGSTSIGKLMLPERELTQSMVVIGKIGYGKTSFVTNILSKLAEEKVPFFIVDIKGEYGKFFPFAKYYRPGSPEKPLKINIFDEGKDSPEGHVNFLISLFRELFISSENESLSPQMEKLLRDALEEMMGMHLAHRSFSSLQKTIEKIAEGMTSKAPSIMASATALINRLSYFSTGILKDVFGVTSNVDLESLMDFPIILDMSYLLPAGGKLAIRLLTYLMLRYVFSEALHRGNANTLRHVTVIEDSHLIVPDLFSKKSTGDTNVVEDMLMIERSLGIGLILVSTRAIISKNLFQNAGTKVYFRSEESREEIGGIDLTTLKVGEAVVLLPTQDTPIKIKVPPPPGVARENRCLSRGPSEDTFLVKGNTVVCRGMPLVMEEGKRYIVISDVPVVKKVRENVYLFPRKLASHIINNSNLESSDVYFEPSESSKSEKAFPQQHLK
ncbi:MAG: DUF87 domain-containing protein [Candidatus Korarchaeota archaeon]